MQHPEYKIITLLQLLDDKLCKNTNSITHIQLASITTSDGGMELYIKKNEFSSVLAILFLCASWQTKIQFLCTYWQTQYY